MNQKSPNQDPTSTELILIPRLKWMGYLLVIFSTLAIAYSFTLANTKPDDQFESAEEQEVSAGISLDAGEENFSLSSSDSRTYYFAAGVFALVGSFCIIYATRRKAKIED